MPLSNVYRALAAAAFVGLFAGCSGGSQLAHFGNLGPQSASHNLLPKASLPAAKAFVSEKAEIARELRGRVVNTNSHWTVFVQPDKRKAKFDYVVSNDINFGNVDMYDETTGTLVAQCAGCGGFGAAADDQTGYLAYGTYGTESAQVVVVHVTAGPTITPVSTLALNTSADGSFGLAFDSANNLYAGDWPTNCWDTFSAAAVDSGGASSGQSCNSAFSVVYYLASHGTSLYVDGYDTNDQLAIGTATGLLQDVVYPGCATSSGSGGIPGGIAIQTTVAAKMAVNNQYGCVTEYQPPYTNAAFHHFKWGSFPNDYTGIALGKGERHIWGVNVNFSSSPSVGYATEWDFRGAVVLASTSPVQSGEEPIAAAVIHN